MSNTHKVAATAVAAAADGVYSAQERQTMTELFSEMTLGEKSRVLRRIADSIRLMPDAGDQGAWEALLQIQDHLRDVMAGGKITAPPPTIDLLNAKRLLRKYAADGVLDVSERLQLKNVLHRFDDRLTERLRRFAVRHAASAAGETRKEGFVRIRRFIEKHQEAGAWLQVNLDEELPQ